MAESQAQMLQFHEAIKLKRFDENETLREKRDRILERLDQGLKKRFADENLPTPVYLATNQGSYEMGNGVKPTDGDYDIDVGLYFNIAKASYPDPVTVKLWIYEALFGHTKRVEVRRPCITVFYEQSGEPQYHVDLAVYSHSGSNSDGKTYLAKGKMNSTEEHRFWEESEVPKLIDLIKNRFQDQDDEQFRRIIRYLKRWKNLKFSSDGNAAPIGIGMAVAGYYWFSPKRINDSFNNTRRYNDLDALGCFVQTVISQFQLRYENGRWVERLQVTLPVAPGCDLFDKMTDLQMVDFKEKLSSLLDTIQEAQRLADPKKACQLLKDEQFGKDFPVPSQTATAQQRPPAIISSSSSA